MYRELGSINTSSSLVLDTIFAPLHCTKITRSDGGIKEKFCLLSFVFILLKQNTEILSKIHSQKV